MGRIRYDELSSDEQEWLKRLYQGGGAAALITRTMARRLTDLGLAESKLGGTGISREGKRLIEERIVAAKRSRDM